MKRMFIFSITSLMLLCAKMGQVYAEAPLIPKILFTSARDDNYEVYVMNPDGSEQLNLTQHRAQDVSAIWSPTGEKILFVSDRGGVRDLYMMNSDGSNVRRVFKTKIEGWRKSPTWSPNGKQFAYAHTNWALLTSIIYIATLGEQEEEHLVEGRDPAWSPDGTEIACAIDGRLTLINVHTGAQKQLLPKKTMNWQRYPSWSTAGDKLTFAWNKHQIPPVLDRDLHNEWIKNLTIYIINRDGTDLKQLVDEAGPRADYPVLSPNGKEVLYTQEINGFLQIFKLDVNSGIRTQLTHIGPRNLGGDWFDPAFALPVSPQPQLLTTTWSLLKRK
jgi:Tol biopolymer transport system component